MIGGNWGAAVGALRMSPAEFWELTPRQFAAAWKWYEDAQTRDDIRIARLMAFYAEMHRDPDKRAQPFVIADFMPKTTAEEDVRWPTEAELLEMEPELRIRYVASMRSQQSSLEQQKALFEVTAKVKVGDVVEGEKLG